MGRPKSQEVEALRRIYSEFQGFDYKTRNRMLSWLFGRVKADVSKAIHRNARRRRKSKISNGACAV